jgi:hypothetical protein
MNEQSKRALIGVPNSLHTFGSQPKSIRTMESLIVALFYFLFFIFGQEMFME